MALSHTFTQNMHTFTLIKQGLAQRVLGNGPLLTEVNEFSPCEI